MGLLSRAAKMIRAYHGSPHDFDKFEYSPRTALTGEGAAAFGPGLYFAEKEAVARQYRDVLSDDVFRTGEGKLFDPSGLEHLNVRSAARTGNVDAAIYRAKQILASPDTPPATRAMAESDLAILEQIKTSGGLNKNEGRMYEVDIGATADDLVDWDTSLASQSPAVRAAADELFKGDWQAWNPRGAELVSGVWNDARKTQDTGAILDVLKDKGIKGTRFLDQGSRGPGDWRILKPTESTTGKWVAGYAPNGPNRYFDTEEELAKYVAAEEAKRTRNYAIWDDKIIDILRKYGVPIAATGATGGLLSRVGQSQSA